LLRTDLPEFPQILQPHFQTQLGCWSAVVARPASRQITLRQKYRQAKKAERLDDTRFALLDLPAGLKLIAIAGK
jgi:hypothetical protein